jgi:hypothetical protein
MQAHERHELAPIWPRNYIKERSAFGHSRMVERLLALMPPLSHYWVDWNGVEIKRKQETLLFVLLSERTD